MAIPPVSTKMVDMLSNLNGFKKMGLRTFKKGELVKIVTGAGGEFSGNIEKFVLNNSYVYVTGSFTMWHLKTQVRKLQHV